MSKPVVVLDPGHGGYDPGAVGYGLKEKDLNLELALMVAERLRGVRVLMTRENDIFVSLANRVAFSRRAEPELFLSLHANAGGGRGFESFICSSKGASAAAATIQAAVHGRIMAALGDYKVVDRGMKRAAFYVLRHNPHPAVLIESLFIDNEREAELWRDRGFVETLAGGAASGVLAALKLPGGDFKGPGGPGEPEARPTTPSPVEKSRLYTVQVGAFKYLDNARYRLAEAQAAGFDDAYIYEKQV